MHIFPITKVSSGEFDEDITEILGYKVVSPDGKVLGTGEDEEEALQAALAVSYLAESNEDNSRKIKLDPKLFRKKTAQKC